MLNHKVVILPPPPSLTFGKLASFTILCIVTLLTLFSQSVQADIVMSLTKITDEDDIIDVENYGSVKYAINYGQTNVTSQIAGITFVNQGGTSMYYSSDSTNFYNSNMESFNSRNNLGLMTATGSYSGTTSTELNNLLSDMIHNGGQTKNTSTVLTFGNLEAGKTYTARVLARAWAAGDNRVHEFSIDTNADGVADQFTSNIASTMVSTQQVNEDNPFSYMGESESGYTGAYAVDFTFTAQSNTASISLKNVTGNNYGWHNYGVMLIENSTEQVTPTTPTIYNPSFEADSFVIANHSNNQHGYVYEERAGLISGWQFTNKERIGLAWQESVCQDFLCHQTPTDGKQVAYLQSVSDCDTRLYQNVSGFDPTSDTVYRLTMDWGRRTQYETPIGSLFIGADKETEIAYISNKTISGGFESVSTVFRPNASTQTIAIQNKTSGDSSLLVDNVQLKAYQMNTFFSDNYHVKDKRNGTAIGGPSDNDESDRFSAGIMGALGYGCQITDDDQVQVNNTGEGAGHLYLEDTSNTTKSAYTSPNFNFNTNMGTTTVAEEGGRMYEISFKVNPAYDDADPIYWAAVVFGASESKRYAFVTESDGVGILFRKNGEVHIFDGSKQIDPTEKFTLENDWANVRIDYYVPDFNESSKVDVTLYINDKMIYTFQTSTGFTDNFVQFQTLASQTTASHSLIDDFQVKSSANYYYDASSSTFDLSKNWTLNGKDKHHIQFQSQRGESSSADHTGQLAMEGASYIDVAEGYEFTQSGAITGTGRLTKQGDGTLILTAANSTSGGITISGGTLKLTENGTLGSGEIKNNATLELAGNATLSNVISGTGNVLKTGTGTTTLSGNNTYEGGTTISGGILKLTGDGTLGTGAVALDGGTLEIDKTISFSSSVSGTGKLVIDSGTTTLAQSATLGEVLLNNSTTLHLSSASTIGKLNSVTPVTTTTVYTADQLAKLEVDNAITIQEASEFYGVIQASGKTVTIDTQSSDAVKLYSPSQTSKSTGKFVVASGRLDMKGFYEGLLEVQCGATFSPGNSVGTVELTGDAILKNGSTLLMEIAGTTADLNDQLVVTGTDKTLTVEPGTIINLVLAEGSALAPNDKFEVTIDAEFAEGSKDAFEKGLTSYYFTNLKLESDSLTGNWKVTGTVDPNAVPEPSTWALLILGFAGLMWYRKRERR